MEKQQKELLDWLKQRRAAALIRAELGEIRQPGTEYGPYFRKEARNYDVLRRLVEKFYGEWKGEAQYLLSFSGGTHMDHDGYGRAANLLAKIRNFDPMAAELKEKIKVEVR